MDLQHLLDNNVLWAAQLQEKHPDFFPKLSKQRAPKYLWIGCSDSRVPANEIINLPPSEVFVHRNIANIVVHTDLNCLSVVQYAVEVLKVEHIIVCGHYGCGSIKAALENHQHGLTDNWLRHIKDVMRFNNDELLGLSHDKKLDTLCQLNIKEQVLNICKTTIVQKAWRQGLDLSVHGWIYNIKNGIIENLYSDIASNTTLKSKIQLKTES